MAPTPTTAVPLLIRASLIFSGMLGIRLDGLKDQNGKPVTVHTTMPLNFTVPEVVMNQTVHETDLASNRSENSRCQENCQLNKDIITIHQVQFDAPIKSNNIASSESVHNGFVVPPPLKTIAKLKHEEGLKTKENFSRKSCGPGYCSDGQVCISWIKQRNNTINNFRNHRLESPVVVHECLPDDGIHWNKMRPSGAKLCGKDETHSIRLGTSTRECEVVSGKESCHVTWHYNCVNDKESPHSCKLRKCHDGSCVEIKHCNQNHLCYIEAQCTPRSFSPFHQSLRKKL